MLTMLKGWKGPVEVNGVIYDSVYKIPDLSKVSGTVTIKLLQPGKSFVKSRSNPVTEADKQQYRITVRQYMTKPASADFDFMSKWNNDKPMPLRTMIGTKEKETRGMVYMKLHGDIYAEKVTVCMKCGRPLTNPVSQYFGIGPECGGHGYVNPFDTEEELRAAVNAYRKHLQEITWEGWIIKSSLLEFEKIT